MSPDISIAIINTNNRPLALQCLKSVFETQANLSLEVFVVDNACTDGSSAAIREAFPQVKILENERLLGFSSNNNQVFERSGGRYLMLLNDDTIVQPGSLQDLVSFLDSHPDAAVAGANLFNLDGSWQLCYGREPNPIYEGFRPFSERLSPILPISGAPAEVADVCGACMLVRAAAAKEVGFLDTRFDPLYSEEVDWCYRFRKAGWRVYHLPAARVIHLGGVTMQRASMKRYERIYEKKALFFRKHFGLGTVAAYKTALFLSNLLKSSYWLIRSLPAWRKHPHAHEELKTHWNLAMRALSL